MLRIIRHAFLVAFALALALLAVALARPQWLVPVLADLLPAGWQFDDLTVVARAPRLPKVQRLVLSVAGCRLLDAEDVGATLVWRGLIPALDTVRVGTLAIDLAEGVVGESLSDDTKAFAIVDRFLADLEASEKAAQ